METFYKRNELNRFIDFDTFKGLKQIKLHKGQEVFVDSPSFLIKGHLEIIYIDINGEYLKLKDIKTKDVLAGISNLTRQNDLHLHLYFKAREECLLLKIPENTMQKFLTNVEFCQLLISIFSNYFKVYTTDTLVNNKYSTKERIKYFLKKERTSDNIVYLENVGLFLEKYGLSRATFYRELKKLKESGWLSKDGKKIKINIR